MIRHFVQTDFDLEISIEFPDISAQSIPASRLIIKDMTDPERQVITSINAIAIYCTAGNIIWAEVEMYADLDGRPVLRDKPYIKDNTIVAKVFKAKVTEFRSGASYREGYRQQLGAIHQYE